MWKPLQNTKSVTLVQGCLFAITAFIILMTVVAYHSYLVYRVRISGPRTTPPEAVLSDFSVPPCLFGDLPSARQQPVLRVVVVVYFSIPQKSTYLDQLKWCMRSLLEMAETEPPLWRTDLIIYMENVTLPQVLDLGCSTAPRRNAFQVYPEYERNLQEQMKEYPYLDSIYPLVEHSSSYSKYDFVVRSDLDVFFTPAFAGWIPPNCAFVTGNGGYSDTFNMEKLAHVASYSGIHFNASVRNVGSTWIGTPQLVAKVAERTVHWMVHLSRIEFSPKQRTIAWWGGAPLWMEWHYGVLSMYGGHLAVNEVLESGKRHPYLKLDLDHPTTSSASCTVDGPLHLHTYQSNVYFSKSEFNNRKYVGASALPAFLNSTRCDYAAYLAADSLVMTSVGLAERLRSAKLTTLQKRV
ncbi:hypothetical protein RvY_18389-1 [Ramazzottius varieornatus]|uniref:DUF7164 domain-containing protein n=1 Tax=Ramazzottius varieornatus TaxID=947166 RepID=A0A1D1W610_RAMVA|nr:hypothetical protein RvY_18389-1 [Ramazzottius varieornatus]